MRTLTTKMAKAQQRVALLQSSPLVDTSYFRSRKISSTTDYENETSYTGEMDEFKPCSDVGLAQKCAEYFDINGNCLNDRFPEILFRAHSWIISSKQLTQIFINLFGDESVSMETCQKAIFAVSYWIKKFPHIFDIDADLVSAVNELREVAIAKGYSHTDLLDISNRGMYEWMRHDQMSFRPTHMKRKNHKVSLVFHHLEPEEIAIHMSYLEFKCFRRLTLEDFKKYAKNATIKENPKLERAVILFNNITHWVQCMVLGQKSAQGRAEIIVKFMNISKKLHEMRNYNTLVAVVGALTHTAISRLKQTASYLPKESVKEFHEIVEILDSKKNYSAYRQDYAKSENEFKIPIVGVLMKDLIGLHVSMPDRDTNGYLNVRKMEILSGIFKELSTLQKMQYPLDVNRDLVNTMRVSLYLYYSEDEIYNLSLEREPRDSRNSSSGPSSPDISPMVFAEFAKYTCQLDSESVRQHVTSMVESVFKAYDHDGDGCISEAEFEKFNSNFPGMDSFDKMDVDNLTTLHGRSKVQVDMIPVAKDLTWHANFYQMFHRDGRISNREMLEYFLKASSARRNEFCQSFKHEFVETTYFHFTYCEECDKLLWGLVKQGWKCKGCGINCHKQCKDRIVQECRVKNFRQGFEQMTNGGARKSSNAKRKDIKKSRENSFSLSSEADLKNNNFINNISPKDSKIKQK